MRIMHYIPTKLPVGREEFLEFYQDIIQTYGFPDQPGYKELLAQLIQHIPHSKTKIPKKWFADHLRKSQANETAFHMINEAKQEAKEAIEKEKEIAKTGSVVVTNQEKTPEQTPN